MLSPFDGRKRGSFAMRAIERASERAREVENVHFTEDLVSLEREEIRAGRGDTSARERTREWSSPVTQAGTKETDETDLYIHRRTEESARARGDHV